MARTVLQIAREAAEREATAPAPPRLFQTENKIAKILRTAAGDTVRDYLRTTGWAAQSEFASTWVFSTVPGRYAYPLPPDFLAMIPDTEHINGSPLSVLGPATPDTWAGWVYGGGASRSEMGWRIRNGALWVHPTPTQAQLVTMDYISRYPVVSTIQPGDYDLTKTPPVCIAPFVPRDGQIDLGQDITPEISGTATYDAGPGFEEGVFPVADHEVLKRLSPLSQVAPLPQVRREAFSADTDMPAFTDDHMLSLGMTFRLRRALGMDYAEVAAEYEAEMERKAATDGGGSRGFQIGTCDAPDLVPLGGGRWIVS